MDRLPEDVGEERRILQAAAVAGFAFPHAAQATRVTRPIRASSGSRE